MRDERKVIEDHNDAVMKEQGDIHQEWLDTVWFPAYRKFLAEHGHPIPEVINYSESLGKSYFEDIDYEIEEIPEL